MTIKFFSFSKRYFFTIFSLSLIFTLSSMAWMSEMVYHDEDLRDVRSGFPLGYRSTNFVEGQYYVTGGYLLPQKMNSFEYSGQGRTTTIWHLFFLSVAMVQFVFSVVFFIVYTIFPKIQRFFRFLSVKNIVFSFILFVVAFAAYKLDFYYQFLRAIGHAPAPSAQIQLPAPLIPAPPALPTSR